MMSSPVSPFEHHKRMTAAVLDRAEGAVKATIGLAPVALRLNLSERSIVLTWTLGPGRTMTWYVDEDEDWRPARVVQQGDPSQSHWADVGAVEDLVAILREELGIEGE